MEKKNGIQDNYYHISPIFDSCPDCFGIGVAGFTVYTNDRTFANQIRQYNTNNRKAVLQELEEIRNALLHSAGAGDNITGEEPIEKEYPSE